MTVQLRLRLARTDALSGRELAACRAVCDAAFLDDPDGPFGDDDWAHALGGWHVLGTLAGEVVAHAALVPRPLALDGRWLAGAYLEAVAVRPDLQRRGLGREVVALASRLADRTAPLAALSTGVPQVYEPHGWRRWRGSTWVATATGHRHRTPDEDDGVMVRGVTAPPHGRGDGELTVLDRPGDAW